MILRSFQTPFRKQLEQPKLAYQAFRHLKVLDEVLLMYLHTHNEYEVKPSGSIKFQTGTQGNRYPTSLVFHKER